jgi:hypothetical protein
VPSVAPALRTAGGTSRKAGAMEVKAGGLPVGTGVRIEIDVEAIGQADR